MDFLRKFLDKFNKVPNSAAVLIVFVAWYLSATISTIALTDMLSRILPLAAWVLGSVVVFMTIMFIVSRLIKRTDIVDVAWGPAFAVAATASFVQSPYDTPISWNAQTIISTLVFIWAIRLAYTIFKRFSTHPEDKRYVELREKWKGNIALNTYLRIFLTQAILAVIVSIAVTHINGSLPTAVDGLVLLGTAVWVVGFYFEAVGDRQLKNFLADPKNKGKLMTKGLWSYTRHPNYFGEATMWWGIFIIALATPYGWFGIITPVIITYLLYFVSGVPMTEASFAKKPGWEAYKKRTSKFFPLPPRS